MQIIGGARSVASLPEGGGMLAGGSRVGPRSWRIPALLVGAVLACASMLALAALPGAMAPSIQPRASRDRAHSRPPVLVPIALAAAASTTIGGADHRFWPVRRGASLRTSGGGVRSVFTASGARMHVAHGTLAVSLASVAFGRQVERTATVAPSSAANRVVYRHGSVSESYANGPYGLEQGFRLARRPRTGTGSLVLALRVAGSLTPQLAGSQILFRTHSGAVALRYGQLSALDASGRRLPAAMDIRGGTLQLRIDDANARYPLRIDPFFQQGAKLTGGEESTKGRFGFNVALSSDGSTALIGGYKENAEVGAAWVFTRSGSSWEQQGPKLTGGGESGKAHFGNAVALSSDGNTALIGGGGDNGEVGAAWVFTRSGSTWEQQGAKLTGSGETGSGHFGFRVALSADGNTALIGAPEDNGKVGAAWAFIRTESTWEQQGSKLTGGEEESGKGEFGEGLGLSADGNTALIGGDADNAGVGAAWAFTRSGSTWEQQGPKLTGGGETGTGRFGFCLALSEDGNTALIGAGGDNGEVGAAWVFTRSGSTWEQPGPKLTGSGEVGHGKFGNSVALSGKGETALIGGYTDNGEVGAAWSFTRSMSTWEPQGGKITGGGESGKGLFGSGVALSADGNTALVGGGNDNNELGAAWVFVNVPPQPPTVVTGSASSLTQTSATLNATVNPNGETVTDCHFEYGTSISYGSDVECTTLPGSGVSPVAVSAPIEGLSHGTYHFRIVATNANGTAEGADQKFATEEAPEYGRCVKVTPVKEGSKLVYHGGFTSASCVLRSEAKTGKYEWLQGVVKPGFTLALKEGVVTLETVKKVKTTCKAETGAGEYSASQEVANVVLKLTGCESVGQKCTTDGLAEGELETKKLEGRLGWEVKSSKKVALDLFPVGKTGPFLEYTCTGGVPLTVEGSILVPVVSDKMAATSTLKYKQTAGKQKPERFEGGPSDVLTSTPNGENFEQLGMAATLTEAGEEAIEINAVV